MSWTAYNLSWAWLEMSGPVSLLGGRPAKHRKVAAAHHIDQHRTHLLSHTDQTAQNTSRTNGTHQWRDWGIHGNLMITCIAPLLNTLRTERGGCHFAYKIFIHIFGKENYHISLNWWEVSIVSGNGLAPNQWRDIIWALIQYKDVILPV